MAWAVIAILVGAIALCVAVLRGRRHPGRVAFGVLLVLAVGGALWWRLGGEQVDLVRLAVVDERTVEVGYDTGECSLQSQVDVDEGPDEVVVTVREQAVALSCSDVGVQRVARVRLGEPLGDRRVVDGSDGRELRAA